MNAQEGNEIAFVIAFWPLVLFIGVVFVLCLYLPLRFALWVKDKLDG
jgi:hypothetical protein